MTVDDADEENVVDDDNKELDRLRTWCASLQKTKNGVSPGVAQGSSPKMPFSQQEKKAKGKGEGTVKGEGKGKNTKSRVVPWARYGSMTSKEQTNSWSTGSNWNRGSSKAGGKGAWQGQGHRCLKTKARIHCRTPRFLQLMKGASAWDWLWIR